MTILVFYLNSPEEENVLFGCRIMAGECEMSHFCVGATIKADVVPRVLSLLVHANAEIQAAAARIGTTYLPS